MAQVNRGKTAIEFSGTAAQLRAAFQTELHTYIVNGEVHQANDRDPQIPLALAPVVAGITPMNDFRPRSDTVTRGRATYNVLTHQATPEWTQTTSTLELAPDDFAVQYDVNPLYNAGVTGAGITIGVIGDSNIDPSLVAAYRSLFHLPANPINVILAGNDPGITGSYGEAYLDVEEAGAIAPGATVNFYTAQDTFVQQGTALAALREVDDDVAHVEEELGDLLFQIIFHAELGDEEGRFNLATIADAVRDKLTGRHPHVFGDVQVSGSEEVAARWEVLKRDEKGRESITDGIAWQLPALILYTKLLRKAALVDLRARDAEASRARALAALGALSLNDHAEIDATSSSDVADAWGDALSALVEMAQWAGVDLEGVLRERSLTMRDAIRAAETTAKE